MLRLVLLTAALALSAGHAIAGPECTKEPRANWIPENEMKERLSKQGFKFEVFKITDGNCYEIYGRSAAGKRIEIYFHPVTGALVEEHEG